MTTTPEAKNVSETGDSHAVHVSRPGAVAALVKKAAAGATA
ncbi:hypothetical protein [Streptomyces olivochromogenes]|uniref:Uncharacterized protein n=1 Tax=Streptomyces olivochromogenes TaxID=1963 RepID=A0A250V6Y4_STROL|nr:hypothetical protein [Streptomyces olivochromogenes]GAX49947.1 hypothetical protein SO3561_01437 [Streptomyces olivochromogenes]